MLVASFAAVALAACSNDDASADNRRAAQAVASAKRSATTGFRLEPTTYQPSLAGPTGSLIGTIDPDSLPALSDSAHPCETGSPTPTRSRAALVWIAGISSGKALPVEKRADLASEDCGLDPTIVAVAAGSTIDVYNDDAALHRLTFSGPPLDSTLTMPFFNTGQVVATERVAKRVGLVDVRCTVHPWSRATIAVFDQPYFAVTDEKGRFSIDSVPPGNYTLMIWRADLAKPIARPIHLSADETTNLLIGDGASDQSEKAASGKGAKRSTTIAPKRRAR